MKKLLFSRSCLIILYLALQQFAVSQNVGINGTGAAAAASAMLDITSTNKGLLIPKMALSGTNDVATIPSAATSLLIYNTATVAGANAVSPGYYSWSGTVWLRESSYAGKDWKLTVELQEKSGQKFVSIKPHFLGYYY